jgi:glycosyltransferase involved in cell wall biosynthesis
VPAGDDGVSGLVSIVMPVLDADAWLGEAIESVLTQTYADLELVIVDDGSVDASRDVAAAAAARDPRIRLLALERDPTLTSAARAANAGIAIARGEWIARLDADDICLPNRIERQLAFLQEGGLDGCGALAEAFGGEARTYWFPESHDGIERELIFRVGILHPTLLARAELMRRIPYRREASFEDYEWTVRAVAGRARFGNVQEVLLRHRVHPGQANRRWRPLFLRDMRRYRFQHIMRLFPDTRPAAYQPLAWLVEGADLAGAELEAAGGWLVRLADFPDRTFREKMALRWRLACDRAGAGPGDALRERIEAEILGGGRR